MSDTDFVCRGEWLWLKPAVPSPIRSRLKHSHEKLFWFVKDADKYYFNQKPWLKKVLDASLVRNQTGRGTRNLMNSGNALDREMKPGNFVKSDGMTIEHSWRIIQSGERQKGFEIEGKQKQEHIAPFPEALIKPIVESLCPIDGIVLDPFGGSGTVAKVVRDLNRSAILIELNEKSADYARKRIGIDAINHFKSYLE